MRPLVIAHRGASGRALENTLAAFRLAGTLAADGVELDVHASADGVLFVHHDETVDGVHHIAHTASSKLAGLRLADGSPLPTLSQALTACGTMRVFVEVKSLAPAFDDVLFAALDAGPHPGNYAVHSFDHRIVRRLAERRPSLRCGVLNVSFPVRPAVILEDARATALWQEQRLVDHALVDAVHAADAAIYAWTVDEPARMRELIALGVDALCTNHPDRARALVDA